MGEQHRGGLPLPARRADSPPGLRGPGAAGSHRPAAPNASAGEGTRARPPYLLERRLLSRARAPGAGRSHKRRMVPRTLASHLYIPGRSSSGGRHTPRREPQSCRRRCRLRCFGRSQVQARAYDAIRGPTDSTFPGLREDPLRAADVTSFRPTGKRSPQSAHAQPGPASGKPSNRKPSRPNRLLRKLDWQDWWAGLSLWQSQSGVGLGTRPTDQDHVYSRKGERAT